MSDAPAPPPSDWARQLLTFWFDDHGFDDWYGGGPAFDEAVRDFAGDWHEALRALPADRFLTDPDTALAAAILFDQVPRNIHRHHADAFATDDLARAIARGIVAHGWDRDYPENRRQFAYLPFEHSEDIADQRESLRLFGMLREDPQAGSAWEWAERHHDVIARFGRFPHRNAILGRESTAAEIAFLDQPGSRF